MRCAIALCTFLPLLIRSAADTLDVGVDLYQDSNCFERQDNLMLVDSGCYGNLYSNLTKAFSVRIVGFTGTQKVDLYEYIDACHNTFSAKRTLLVGQCQRFVGGFFAVLSLRFRSTTCSGESCSRIAVAVQSFFSAASCQGLPYQIYTYPVQRECMRWYNGTQTFTVDPSNSNISQIDYIGSDACSGGLTRAYTITNGECYSLYADQPPRSFQWAIQRADAKTSAASRQPILLCRLLTAIVLWIGVVSPFM
jgi:hypothetical protein